MLLVILLSLLSPLLIGWLLVQVLLPAPVNPPDGRSSGYPLLWKLCLAPGAGLALVSLLYFLWSLIFSPTQALAGYLVIEGLLLFGLGVFAWRRRRPAFSLFQELEGPGVRAKGQITQFLNSLLRIKWPAGVQLLTLFAGLVFALFLLNFLSEWQKLAFEKPFGDWDAWAIWNLRAAFIASGDGWLNGFSPVILWSHPDYPLLLPLNVARVWTLLGERAVLAPVIVGLLFQLSLVGLLATSVQMLRGALQGLLAGSVGMAVLFVSLSFRQYADIPLAYYLLAANVLLFIADVSPARQPGPALLAGLMTGAALWTKNEGWALLVAVLAARLLLDLASRAPLARMARWLGLFLLGLLPLLLAAVFFKLTLAPPNDILAGLSLPAVKSKLVEISRYLTILKAVRGQFTHYGNLALPMLPLLLGYGLLAGVSFSKEQRGGILALLLRVAGVSAVYFMIYLLTPNNLAWQLNTSLERLVSQILPSALLLYFLMVSALILPASQKAKQPSQLPSSAISDRRSHENL
jgi:hypothetical protein